MASRGWLEPKWLAGRRREGDESSSGVRFGRLKATKSMASRGSRNSKAALIRGKKSAFWASGGTSRRGDTVKETVGFETERHLQSDKQTDKETDRQTGRQADTLD